MHFIIKENNLKKIRNVLSTLNEYSNSLQESDNLHVLCDKDNLYFLINNSIFSFKLFLKKSKNLEILKIGSFSINLKLFNSIVESLENNEKIEIIKVEDNLIQIYSGNFICNLVTLNYETIKLDDNFEIKKYKKIIFNHEILKIIYNKFSDFCKPLENSINSKTYSTINLKKLKNDLKTKVSNLNDYTAICGTFEIDSMEDFNISIFPKMINILISLFVKNQKIEVFLHENNFLAKNNEMIIKSKIFDDNFNVSIYKWLDSEPKIEFSVNKNLILNAIERSLLLSNKNLKITFYRLENNKLWIEYKGSEKGFSKEHIEVKNSNNKNIEFSVNNELLKKSIKNIDSETIFFRIFDSNKPMMIFGKNYGETFVQFVFPLKSS